MTILKGLLVIVAAFAVLAVASTVTDAEGVIRSQREHEASEDFPMKRDAKSGFLEADMQAEDSALADLGVDVDLEEEEEASRADEREEMESENLVESETRSEEALDSKADEPVYVVPVAPAQPPPPPIILSSPPNAPEYKPIVLSASPAVPHVRISERKAHELLTRLYDVHPYSPFDVAHRLPYSARMALMKVLRKTNNTDVQVSICASFLAAFTEHNDESIAADAEAQEKASILLAAEDKAAALKKSDLTQEEVRKLETLDAENARLLAAESKVAAEMDASLVEASNRAAATKKIREEILSLDQESDRLQSEEASLLESKADPAATTSTASTAAPQTAATTNAAAAATTAGAAAGATAAPAQFQVPPALAAKLALGQQSDNLDVGVSALRKFANVLEDEAVILTKKLAELQRIHKGSIFKAMDRGPVGRRTTAKDRQQVFTNGMRSWEAEAAAEKMRGRPVPTSEADKIYGVEPIPK